MTPAKNTAGDEKHTSLIQLLKAVEVAHEIEAAATRHGTSDSQRLVAHDHVLVQCRRKHRGFSDVLNMHISSDLPKGEPGNFDESATSCLDKAKSVSLRESLWSRASTLPGVGFRRASRCDDAATIEVRCASLPVLGATHRSPSPTIDLTRESRAPIGSTHHDAPVTIELPRVSLPFLHSAHRDASPTPEACWEAPCGDDLFRGRDRRLEDVVAIVAWLDE
jgi:hypothetical protein